MSDFRSEEPIFKYAHVAMMILFIMIAGLVLSANPEKRILLAGIYAAIMAITLIRHLLLTGKQHRMWQLFLPYLEGSLVVLAIFIADNTAGLSILNLIVWDIALDFSAPYSVVYAISGYFSYMLIYINPVLALPLLTIIAYFTIAAFQFLLYVGFAFLARSYSIQSRTLRQTTADLQAEMITAEEMTTLKERNRIAMEIHNTVGHQLTTALVQIEAARMIFEHDPAESKKRLEISKEQVQQGLSMLRQAVHTIKADQDYDDFAGAVETLLTQVRANTAITLDAVLDDISDARLQMKKTIYHMILESITNGIRHGHARKMKIRLQRDRGLAVITCHNDGMMPKEINFGYGLRKITEQIEELGGTLSVDISPDGWFGLKAQVPLVPQKGDAYGKD
jgi:signal transduction histidine kinase